MSDSVRPHRWQPTRLPHPWISPGKNTGMGCHFLLQCMKVKSQSEVAQSCPTLSDLMDCSLPGSSVDGIFQAKVLEWGAIAFSGIYTHAHTYIYICGIHMYGLSRWFSDEEPACQCRSCKFNPWVWNIPWRRKWQPTPVLLPGESHG